MTNETTADSEPPNSSPAPIVLPVVIWTLVQLIPLLLSCNRIALWARPAGTAEDYALIWMLCAQVAASALLFPWLMQSPRSTTFVVLITLPFLQLAGIIAHTPLATLACDVSLIWMWLISLSLWRAVLTRPAAQLLAVAVASVVSVGYAASQYLRIDFADEAEQGFPGVRRAVIISLCVLLACSLIAFLMRGTMRATGYPPVTHRDPTTNGGKPGPFG